MRARLNPLHSESGDVQPGLIITLAFVALGAWILLAAFEADTSHYGTVPVPSEGKTVELPDAEIDVYYAEAVAGDSTDPLITPTDLTFSVANAETGQGVRIDARGGEPEETDGGSARVVGAVFTPEEGDYKVVVDSGEVEGRPKPQLTFGQTPLQAIADRFDEVVDELKGPTGIVVAVVIVLLLLLPTGQRLLRER